MERDEGRRLLADFERLWHVKRGSRVLPARKDFTFEDLRWWMGHIRVVRVEYEPLRLTVTLDGAEIVNASGVDLTGKDLAVVYGSDRLSFLLGGYRKTIESKAPLFDTLLPNAHVTSFGEINRLFAPCGTDDMVEYLLYCEYAHDVFHWGRTMFADIGDLNL